MKDCWESFVRDFLCRFCDKRVTSRVPRTAPGIAKVHALASAASLFKDQASNIATPNSPHKKLQCLKEGGTKYEPIQCGEYILEKYRTTYSVKTAAAAEQAIAA